MLEVVVCCWHMAISWSTQGTKQCSRGFYWSFLSRSFRSLLIKVFDSLPTVSVLLYLVFVDSSSFFWAWKEVELIKLGFLQFLCAFVGFFFCPNSPSCYISFEFLPSLCPASSNIIYAVLFPISPHHHPGQAHWYSKAPCLHTAPCLQLRWEVLQWCGFKVQIWISQPVALAWLFIVCY